MEWIVIAAGEMRNRDYWHDLLRTSRNILCADNGYSYCQELGIEPKAIIGDFDSLLKAPPAHIACERHPQNKDTSDSQLAVTAAFARGAERVLLLGGFGSRLDHTYANLLLLGKYPGKLFMVDGDCEAVAVDQSYRFQSQKGETCSLLPLGTSEVIVTTHGLLYPLTEEPLHSVGHGLSNKATTASVEVRVHRGSLILWRLWEPYTNRAPLKS